MKREKQESILEKATTNVKALKSVETIAETKGKVAIEVMQEKGITLVALVITIVIIIILATITINMAFGDNGLIKQAEDARDYYANDTSYTEDSLTNVSSYLNELLAGTDTSNEKTLVQAFKDGEIEAGDYVNYKPSEVKSITVGTDKTGYTNSNSMSEGTDQTFTTDMNTTWQVLGLSEDGQHLLLTSGSPIKKDEEDPYLVLQGAEKNSLRKGIKVGTIFRVAM